MALSLSERQIAFRALVYLTDKTNINVKNLCLLFKQMILFDRVEGFQKPFRTFNLPVSQ